MSKSVRKSPKKNWRAVQLTPKGKRALAATAPPVLTVTPLGSCEDEGMQKTLTRLLDIDAAFSRDMAIQGALPDGCEDWARLHGYVDAVAPSTCLGVLEDVVWDAYVTRLETAYLGGVAVGLRLAKLDGGLR